MKVLFQDGPWRLVAFSTDTSTSYGSLQHYCNRKPVGWYHVHNKTICGTCGLGPPTELIGLKTLHNWDR